MWTTEQLGQNLSDELIVFRSTEGSTEASPRLFAKPVLWIHAAKKVGKWYRGVLEAPKRLMTRWHVEEAKKKLGSPRSPDAWGPNARAGGGGVGKTLLKKAEWRRQTGRKVSG